MKVFVGTEKTSVNNVSGNPLISSEVLFTVDLFQSELLSFSDKTEDHKPGDKVKPSIEADWSQGQRIAQ